MDPDPADLVAQDRVGPAARETPVARAGPGDTNRAAVTGDTADMVPAGMTLADPAGITLADQAGTIQAVQGGRVDPVNPAVPGRVTPAVTTPADMTRADMTRADRVTQAGTIKAHPAPRGRTAPGRMPAVPVLTAADRRAAATCREAPIPAAAIRPVDLTLPREATRAVAATRSR